MAENTAKIKYLIDEDGIVWLPVTHERAVLDNEGTTLETKLGQKQATLVSGENIKTINGDSILGSGNIEVQTEITLDNVPTAGSNNPAKSGGIYTALSAKQDSLISGTNLKTINSQSLLGSGDIETGSGIDTVRVTVDSNTGTPSGTGSITGNTLTLSFHNLRGEQGNTGSSVDFPYELVNNLTTNDATKGLSAAQGKELKSLINTVAYNVQTIIDNLANIAYVGDVPTYEDMGVVSPTWSISTDLTNYTMAQSISTVVRNRSYENTLVPDSGYKIGTATITMGGTDITSQCFNSSTGAINIAMVTGNVSISGIATEAPNTELAFRNVRIDGKDPNYAYFKDYDEDFMISPLMETSQGDSLTFSVGTTGRANGLLLFFNSSCEEFSYFEPTANPRTVTVASENASYCALCFRIENLASAFVTNATTGVSLFDGSTIDSSKIMSGSLFRSKSPLSATIPWENENGDLMNWNFADASTPYAGARDTYNPPKYVYFGRNASQYEMNSFISKDIDLTNVSVDGSGKHSLTFYCGGVASSGGAYLLFYNDNGEIASYYEAQASARTVAAGSSYNRCRVLSTAASYADCYVKDALTDTVLWTGSPSNE